ncbi:MAG: sugar transferase, partial [Armatimonadota bacterium]|nr:sugar transferase [Armatimonadota bacterium]
MLEERLGHGTPHLHSDRPQPSPYPSLASSPALDKALQRARRNRRRGRNAVWPRRRILIVGLGETGQTLAQAIETHFPEDYVVVGFAADDPNAVSNAAPGSGLNVLGSREELDELVERYGIDKVMIADFSASDDADVNAISYSSKLRTTFSPFYLAGKRAFDIIVSLTALALGAPLMALAAAAVKLTSPGPIFYRQERVGRGGRPFTIYKFRTMTVEAEVKTGPVLAQRRDPRVTRVGRILRATHLDEWPQFFNVLRGDMSIVGPRPERAYFVQSYCHHIPNYAQRHAILPGLTGLAQISGDGLTHVYVKLHYDLMYAYNQSLWLDLIILARTPLA